MKANIKIRQITVVFLLFLSSSYITAQCTPGNALSCTGTSFPINNNRGCDVTIQYEVSACQANSTCGGIGVTCSGVVTIPAMSTYYTCCWPNPATSPPVTTSGCPCGGDISVWLKEINGADVTGGGYNYFQISAGNCLAALGGSSVNVPVPSTVTGACATPSNYQVIFTGSAVDIW